ncbi:MAG TPA: metallophosphoesterase [Vicinamibacterales bacterium]|nr:metallophosphoesterase [Vicinamibacterales bacterium]
MRTIVHLSDLHFGRIDERIIAPLVDHIISIQPDLVAVSGDLTQRARRRQFQQASTFLTRLPFPKIVVPGNHDVPLFNVAARLLDPFGGYRKGISPDLEPAFIDDEIAVVGLNSARGLITGGRGRLNAQQIDAAVARLRALPPSAIRVIVTHHPFDLPEGIPDHHLVGRASLAMQQFATAGADLFLAGHLHVSHVGHTADRYNIAGHSALVVQAGTLSTRGRGELNTFNVLRIARPEMAIERYSWQTGSLTFDQSFAGTFRHTPDGWTA